MSYLNQNYFNNFQVKNPILKNPTNRNAPLQLQKVRPSQLATGANTLSVTNQNILIQTEDIVCSSLRVNPGYTNTCYILPSANQLINLLGVQSNGLSTPSYSNAVQTGDVLIIPVVNTSMTGCAIVAGANTTGSNESTGSILIPGRPTNNQGGNPRGTLSQLVIDFNNVSSGSGGVTGSYLVYGISATGTQ